jgi:hypothetical protein
MILSIDAEKSLWKNSSPFHDKSSEELGIDVFSSA